MAGAILGVVQVSLFLVGSILGEIWNGSRSANFFQYKMRVASVKNNLSCRVGCGVTGSWSDRPRVVNSDTIFLILGMSFFVAGRQAQYLVMLEGDSCCSAQLMSMPSCVATIKHECCSSIAFCIPQVAPRNVNDISCVATFKHECRI